MLEWLIGVSVTLLIAVAGGAYRLGGDRARKNNGHGKIDINRYVSKDMCERIHIDEARLQAERAAAAANARQETDRRLDEMNTEIKGVRQGLQAVRNELSAIQLPLVKLQAWVEAREDQ